MKNKIFILILFLISINSAKAQYSIGVSYIFSDISTHNVAILGKYNLKNKHQFNVGIKYHFNDDSTKPLFRHYYRNLYSTNIWNRLGISFEYRLYFKQGKFINPYFFYNFQYSRMGSKFKGVYTHDGKVFFEKPETLDPINIYENHVGLGLEAKLDERMKFSIGLCVGGTFFTDMRDLADLDRGTSKNVFVSSRKEEFSWLFNTGLSYKIGKLKKNKK